ncbi:hypothetical protein [Clavibacter michiganensis]|uniref:hypothetical protein n=1 Tax=Clavibacter michiganensis TaxID=28447 RepID=UPI001FF6C028|nr:hypothetical protein [Clavibacter michiganensis]UOW04389.1 hypothetical protein MU580_03690 [Clavibacter michiganensis subsp. michiganensis]
MEAFEVTVLGERWRIAEREPMGATPAYDLDWLDGPADGTYGFAVGGAPLTPEQLIAEATPFVEGFSEAGGIGEDFPGFVPARFRDAGFRDARFRDARFRDAGFRDAG